MPDRVLPALPVLMIVGESLHDQLYPVERDPVMGRVLNRHGDEPLRCTNRAASG